MDGNKIVGKVRPLSVFVEVVMNAFPEEWTAEALSLASQGKRFYLEGIDQSRPEHRDLFNKITGEYGYHHVLEIENGDFVRAVFFKKAEPELFTVSNR